MQPEKRTKSNVGVGIGLILQVLGFTFAGQEDTTAILGIVLLVVSVPVFVWGCMYYAEGKGHSKWVGLVALASLVGLIVLILLPDQDRQGPVGGLQTRKLAGVISLLAGFVLVVLGLWLDRLGVEDVRLERLMFPWPAISMVVGACLTIGSLVLMLGHGDQHPPEGDES